MFYTLRKCKAGRAGKKNLPYKGQGKSNLTQCSNMLNIKNAGKEPKNIDFSAFLLRFSFLTEKGHGNFDRNFLAQERKNAGFLEVTKWREKMKKSLKKT